MFPDALWVVQVVEVVEAVLHCGFADHRQVERPCLRPDAGHGYRACLSDLRKHPVPIVGGGVALLLRRPVRINLSGEVRTRLRLALLWRYKIIMSTTDSAKKSRKGRPNVDSEAINVRIERAQLGNLDDWRRAQPDLPTRPEAIRRLIELGLEAATVEKGKAP
jgi:hypothetical protein